MLYINDDKTVVSDKIVHCITQPGEFTVVTINCTFHPQSGMTQMKFQCLILFECLNLTFPYCKNIFWYVKDYCTFENVFWLIFLEEYNINISHRFWIAQSILSVYMHLYYCTVSSTVNDDHVIIYCSLVCWTMYLYLHFCFIVLLLNLKKEVIIFTLAMWNSSMTLKFK